VNTETVYADAGPLIALARIGRLDLLTLLPVPVRVTAEVWQEATGNPDWPGAAALLDAAHQGMLLVVHEGDAAHFPDLDVGEATTLSAAAAACAAILIDDIRARATLRRPSRQFTGTVGLILLARRAGMTPAVRPLLDDLRRETFRISRRLYEEALRAAGEWPP
jgi:predicted nucleic acid-binding protein